MGREKRRYPRFLEADVERAFICAYYELVCGMYVTVEDTGCNKECVAMAWKPGLMLGMDFSTLYSGDMKLKTWMKWLREKLDDLKRMAEMNERKAFTDEPAPLLYEIWCFIPPHQRVLETVERAKSENLPVELVELEEVGRRLLQAASVEVEDREAVTQNAFLWMARILRNTGAMDKLK